MDPTVQRELFRKLARHLASGHSPEQIAREMDYPQRIVEQLLLDEGFHDFFKEAHPKAFALWKEVRAEEDAEQIVQHYLRSMSLQNAKALQKLADSGDLKAADEARIREALLKMSGSLHEEAVVETVRISAQHLAALKEGMKEVDNLN